MKKKHERLSIENIILALYFLLTPFEAMLNFGYGTIHRYLIVLYICFALLTIYKRNIKIKKNDSIILLVIIMLMIPMLSIIWALDTNVAIKRNQAYLLLTGMFLITYIRKCNSREFNLIKKAIVTSGIILAVYMITLNKDLLFAGRAVLTEESGPNGLAAHLMMPFFLSFSIGFDSKGKKRLLNYLFSGFILFIILMTGSRGALLSVGAGLFMSINMSFKKHSKIKAVKMILGGLLAGIIIFQFIPPEVMQRFFGEQALSRDLTSTMSRTSIWKDTFRYLIPERPILGYGSGNSALAMEQIRGYYMVSHNTYLNMIVEYGVLFIPVFGTFIYYLYKELKNTRQYYVAVISLTVILIIAFFLNAYSFKSFWNVFIFIGLFINIQQDLTIDSKSNGGQK